MLVQARPDRPCPSGRDLAFVGWHRKSGRPKSPRLRIASPSGRSDPFEGRRFRRTSRERLPALRMSFSARPLARSRSIGTPVAREQHRDRKRLRAPRSVRGRTGTTNTTMRFTVEGPFRPRVVPRRGSAVEPPRRPGVCPRPRVQAVDEVQVRLAAVAERLQRSRRERAGCRPWRIGIARNRSVQAGGETRRYPRSC